MMTTPVPMKVGDVFRFHYFERAKYSGHCFDGQLVVMERYGGLVLCDTYWGFNRCDQDTKRFTPEQAEREGELTFVCNLGDVEEIKDYEAPLYADGDTFNLSHQHGCYRKWAKRKGARRDRAAILRNAQEKLADARRKAQSAMHSVEWAARQYQKAETATDDELQRLIP